MRLKKFLLLAAAAAALLLGACSSNQSMEAKDLPVHLTRTDTISLPNFQSPHPISRQQLLSIHYAGKEHQIIALLQAEGSTIRLSILSPLGIRLYDAVCTDGVLSTKALIAVEQLPPAQQVLFDIMLTLLPPDDIAPVLPPGWRIEDRDNKRTICAADESLIYSIAFKEQPGDLVPLRLQQLIFAYEIVFTDLT